MTQEPNKPISYQELADKKKLHLWHTYMAQVEEIALQHRYHFDPEIVLARKIISIDARRHNFFASFNDDGTIGAFCIVVVSFDQAELLWAATHEDHQNEGKMSLLYKDIEDYLFSSEHPQISKIIGMCATLDSKFVKQGNPEEQDDRIGAWKKTHSFHKKMEYRFTYRLEDYWGEGMHAYVFMKQREKRLYGYTPTPALGTDKQTLSETGDLYPEINRLIQQKMRDYLEIFHEWFIKDVPPVTPEIQGFTGFAMVNPAVEKATMFAQISTEAETTAGVVMKFEYAIESSALTRIFAEIDHGNSVGILYYPVSWDNKSELNLTYFCTKFYPSLSTTNGYTVFYSKQEGAMGHYSVLYFVTPRIENVVWYNPLWRSFSNYSFALSLLVYNYLASLRILQPELASSEYFRGLIQCLLPEDYPEDKGDFRSKFVRETTSIQGAISNHHRAILRSKDMAFRNTGHLMRNRCESVQRHLEEATGKTLSDYKSFLDQDISQLKSLKYSEEHMYLAMHSAQNLSDYFQVLQLWYFDSLNAVWNEYAKNPEKLERYFTAADSRLDLSRFLNHEAHFIIGRQSFADWGECIVTLRVLDFKQHKIWLKPNIRFSPNIDPPRLFRLSEFVLSNIFFEVFLNAVRHGMINNNEDELKKGCASVSITFAAGSHKGTPVILMLNEVLLNSDEAKVKYEEIPETFKEVNTISGKGLGLVAQGLHELGLGNIWVKRYNNADGNFYVAAIDLKGLEIEEVT